jgi:hypothetical protein
MQKRLDYKCPYDISTMPKVNGNYYCSSCQKSVHDLAQKSDFQVIKQISEFKSQQCISIQPTRLSLVTKKISKWQLFIFLALNFKSFFLQKIYSQTNNNSAPVTPTTNSVVRTLTGKVLDDKTGKPVKNPTIELYKSNILMQKVEGDQNGNFTLLIRGNSNHSDTISLKINSSAYVGTVIKNLPLKKLKSKLEAKIPKVGPVPEIGPDENITDPWTGRLLE